MSQGAARRTELVTRLADPADEYHFADATTDEVAAELEDRDYYRAANALPFGRALAA